MFNRTKIICTIGPASESPKVLSQMIDAGMDSVRINFSHGTYEQFTSIISRIREVSAQKKTEIGIIQDLQGPKIRIGTIAKEGIKVANGDKIKLTIKNEKGATLPANGRPQVVAGATIPVQYKHLPKDVKKGDTLLIADGLIELTVLGVNAAKTTIDCEVVVGGLIESNKGINVPTASISAPCLTEKDKRDVEFGVKQGVDYVALSFVRDAKDVIKLRKLLRSLGSKAGIISKIERHEAIENLDAIIEVSDAVMVARGDLGVEVPAEQVPLIQRHIINVCNNLGKPVIVATQMLASMVDNPRPTRAEISDAAHAILDHADAMMLSNETAVGKYPVEAAGVLSKVAQAVEADLEKRGHLLKFVRDDNMRITNATCLNATKLAHDIQAKYIVAVTRSGYTAREIAKYRPSIPLLVFSSDATVARKMSIVYGVKRTFVQWIELENPLKQIRTSLIKDGLVKEGDEIVICNAGFGKREKLITTTMI